MGRFDEKYTDEQRQAIRRRTSLDGVSSKQAMREAANGELYGLEPFQISYSYTCELARDEKTRRRLQEIDATAASGDPEAIIDAHIGEILAMADHTIRLLNRRGTREPMTSAELDQCRKAVALEREVRGLIRGIPRTAAGRDNQKRSAEAAEKAKHPAAQQDESPLAQGLIENLGNGDTGTDGEAQQEGEPEDTEAETPVRTHVPALGEGGGQARELAHA